MSDGFIVGDVFEELEGLEDESFDAIVSDPPYGFPGGGFMGRSWDNLGDAEKAMQWHRRWLELALPKLRPGGRVLAASGSRVFQRLAFAAELAGLVVDPAFFWINGSAMAQGLAIDKAIDKAAGAEREVVAEQRVAGRSSGFSKLRQDSASGIFGLEEKILTQTAPATPLAALFEGYATRLKDAVCPWLMAHKAPDGTWAQNAEGHGLAGLDVDGGRVPAVAESLEQGPRRHLVRGGDQSTNYRRQAGARAGPQGRYPSNLALSPEAAEELDAQAGPLRSGAMRRGPRMSKRATYNDPAGNRGESVTENGEEGALASRFFHTFRYQAKTGPAERLKGCESFFWRVSRDHPLGFERIDIDTWVSMDHLPGCEAKRKRKRKGGAPSDLDGLALFDILELELRDEPERGCRPGCQHRKRYRGNIHPTLKPIELIKYLAGLVLPPDTGRPRRVLVPFAGTGSEVIGCRLAGWDEVVGIEAEPVYVEIGEARRRAWVQETAEQLLLAGAAR